MLVDSDRLAFLVPVDKIKKFSAVRESILAEKSVNLVTLQKFAGKCAFFYVSCA